MYSLAKSVISDLGLCDIRPPRLGLNIRITMFIVNCHF